jgi:hypothetical protein
VHLDSEGGYVMGAFGPLAVVTNRGKGSLVLGNLAGGQRAIITDVGHGSLLLGAGVVSNSQSIVVGDDNASHGAKSVTAGSFWAMGLGFVGKGTGLTDLREYDTNALAAVAAHAGVVVGAHGAKIERYVAVGGGHVSPFTSWATAATNIQAAVDVARDGETVWVGDGVYGTGSRAALSWQWRVIVTNAVTLRSVNGPQSTVIKGATNAACAYLQTNAVLIGITLTNGFGGEFCIIGGSMSNCVVASCFGENAPVLSNTLYNCTLKDNWGNWYAGAAYHCTFYNCLLVNNRADNIIAYESKLYNCTLIKNPCDGGQLYTSEGINCILAENGNDGPAPTCLFWIPRRFMWGEWEEEQGVNPQFVDYAGGDYRLKAGSPCINAGTNGAWVARTVDLDGQRRVWPAGGRVDIGAYESVCDAEAWHKGDSVIGVTASLWVTNAMDVVARASNAVLSEKVGTLVVSNGILASEMAALWASNEVLCSGSSGKVTNRYGWIPADYLFGGTQETLGNANGSAVFTRHERSRSDMAGPISCPTPTGYNSNMVFRWYAYHTITGTYAMACRWRAGGLKPWLSATSGLFTATTSLTNLSTSSLSVTVPAAGAVLLDMEYWMVPANTAGGGAGGGVGYVRGMGIEFGERL